MSLCIALNFGITTRVSITTKTTITATPIIVIVVSSLLLPDIFIIAPPAIIGAVMSRRKPIVINMSICCTSFVHRVMRLAVLNLLISSSEKDSTLSKIFLRSIAPKPAAMRAAIKLVTTVQSRLPKDMPIILKPACQTCSIVLPGIVMSAMISDIYSGKARSSSTCNTMNATITTASTQYCHLKFLRIFNICHLPLIHQFMHKKN